MADVSLGVVLMSKKFIYTPLIGKMYRSMQMRGCQNTVDLSSIAKLFKFVSQELCNQYPLRTVLFLALHTKLKSRPNTASLANGFVFYLLFEYFHKNHITEPYSSSSELVHVCFKTFCQHCEMTPPLPFPDIFSEIRLAILKSKIRFSLIIHITCKAFQTL